MSYSRWGPESRWYTFYCVSYSWLRDEQLFEICGQKTFRYKELKDDIGGCLASVREQDPEATDEEIEELRGYMLEFMQDAESDKAFDYYEQLLRHDFSNINEIINWFNTEEYIDKDLKPVLEEAFNILRAPDNDIPLMMGLIEEDLGKSLLEGRLKGSIKQITGL